MNRKRGEVLQAFLFMLIQLTLAGMVFWGLMGFAVALKDNLLLEKNYLTKDSALIIDTLYAVPEMIYSYKLTEFDLDRYYLSFGLVDNNYMAGARERPTEDNRDPLMITYPYAEDRLNSHPIDSEVEYKASFYFEKTDNIRITDRPSFRTEGCLGTTQVDSVNVVAGHSQGTPENILSEAIAQEIRDALKGKGIIAKKELPAAEGGLAIVILLQAEDHVKAFVSGIATQNTKGIACNMITEIWGMKKSYAELNPEYIDGKSIYSALQSGNAIVVETGFEDPAKHSAEISRAVLKYVSVK